MRFGGSVLALATLVLLLAPSARAEEAAPPVTLEVTPSHGGGPWKAVVRNDGDLPIRIAADPRLLVLDLFPERPTPKLPVLRCALPSDTRPSGDEGHELVIPAKRSWSMTFDPLFYCFGAKERALLVAGTTVKPQFGWPAPLNPPKRRSKKRSKGPEEAAPPFAVSPVGAGVGQLRSEKSLAGSTFTLTEPVTIAPPPTSAAAASGGDEQASSDKSKPALSISGSPTVDVARGVEVPLTVMVTNESDKSVIVFLRASTLGFTVNGPAGSVSCGQPRSIEVPPRELFTTLGKKRSTSTRILVTALCPDGTFDEPGIYRVAPRLDTRGTSGRSFGLRTWDGEVAAKSPSLVRVRRPPTPELPKKPKLD